MIRERDTAGRYVPIDAEQRFWSKVKKTDTCWTWQGTRHNAKHDYGQFSVGNRYVLAHRFAYELLVGPISDGLELDHLCRNPPCVNPEHLEPVLHVENVRRGLLSTRIQVLCKRGHPLSKAFVRPDGTRACRLCHNARDRKRYHQRRGVIAVARLEVPNG